MEETWRRCGEIYVRLAREGPSKNKGNRTQKKSIAIYDAISSGKNWMGKWHLIQKQRTELHRKEKSLKHILVRTTPKNLKSLLDGRNPGGPSILFNSSFTSRDLHLARSSSTLWCNKIFANWLLVGPFCWYFLSSLSCYLLPKSKVPDLLCGFVAWNHVKKNKLKKKKKKNSDFKI